MSMSTIQRKEPTSIGRKNDLKPISEVHNIDFMLFSKQLPDNFFDLCIADPWYGVGMFKRDTTGSQNADLEIRN